MPQGLPTIEEFIATDIKRQGYWIVFNTGYNDVHVFKKSPEIDEVSGMRRYLVQEDTDELARNEFLAFMEQNYPSVRLVNVFDRVSLNYQVWPYLGSIAIDMQPGEDVYAALSEKYNDPELDPRVNNAVLWTMNYDNAFMCHRDRVAQIEYEFV
jgi:hypothetical protein